MFLENIQNPDQKYLSRCIGIPAVPPQGHYPSSVIQFFKIPSKTGGGVKKVPHSHRHIAQAYTQCYYLLGNFFVGSKNRGTNEFRQVSFQERIKFLWKHTP